VDCVPELRLIQIKILDLFFPPKCIFCRKILVDNEVHVCNRCAELLPLPQTKVEVKHGCPFLDEACAPFSYSGAVRSALMRYKFNDKTGYAKYFGDMMSKTVNNAWDTQFDIVTWVPLSRKRLRRRGYDQAFLLAKVVSENLNIPLARTLNKVKDVKKQSLVYSVDERRANVAGAYCAIDGVAENKNVLIVDDIITTGETVSECARMLLMDGAKKVYCITAAQTFKNVEKTKSI